jgi:hypothetical protein
MKQATWRPQRQHKYFNKRTLTISTPSAEAHGWHNDIGKNWHNRASASGEYTITPKDGRVRPKHIDELMDKRTNIRCTQRMQAHSARVVFRANGFLQKCAVITEFVL